MAGLLSCTTLRKHWNGVQDLNTKHSYYIILQLWNPAQWVLDYSLYLYLRQFRLYKKHFFWPHLKTVIMSERVPQWNSIYNQVTLHMGQCSQSFNHINQPMATLTGTNNISHQINESFRLLVFLLTVLNAHEHLDWGS